MITNSRPNPRGLKTAIKKFTQDKNGNTVQVDEYDFIAHSSITYTGGRPTVPSGISSSRKRITKTDFYNPTPEASVATYNHTDSYHVATNTGRLRLSPFAEVQDGSGTPASRSEFVYDNASAPTNARKRKE